MTDEAKRCVESCREWYQAFSNMGKGNEPSVKELLTTADLIESLAAELEQVKRERDAAVKDLKGLCDVCAHDNTCDEAWCGDCGMFDECKSPCKTCSYEDNWQWRGVKEET